MPTAAKLLTLTEVSKRTKISMPTLQRYKKLYQNRIPSSGEGRKQRYPKEALAVFLQLKKENLGRRGRPRKHPLPTTETAKTASAAKPGKKPAARKPAAKAGSTEGLLTLTQVSKMTGISYPTLLRYVKNNIKDIPHKGTGRARRYKPEAVAVFKDLRARSRRGRKPKAATVAAAAAATRSAAKARATKAPATRRRGRPPKVIDPAELLARITELEKAQRKLQRLCARQQKQLDKPFRVVLKRK